MLIIINNNNDLLIILKVIQVHGFEHGFAIENSFEHSFVNIEFVIENTCNFEHGFVNINKMALNMALL